MAGETLVTVPNTQLFQVEQDGQKVELVADGEFSIAYTNAVDSQLAAQVGSVRWPLHRGAAALRFDARTYTFHLPSRPGTYYCLALAPDTPPELLDLLPAVLAAATAYHQQQDQQQAAYLPGGVPAVETREQEPGQQQQQQGGGQVPPQQVAGAGRADTIAAGLQKGGQVAAAGVMAVAGLLGAAMHRGAEAAVARMRPADKPVEVSAETQARLERAKSVAARVADVSGKAVGAAFGLTAQAAGAIAERITSSSTGRPEGSNGSASALRKVGVAGVEALEALYDSLADAARVVLAHTHVATTRVVEHKYGAQAAQATGTGIGVAACAMETGLNVYKLRPTALAKSVFKGAAKNVVLHGGAPPAAGGPMPSAASDPGLGLGLGRPQDGSCSSLAGAAAGAAASGGGPPSVHSSLSTPALSGPGGYPQIGASQHSPHPQQQQQQQRLHQSPVAPAGGPQHVQLAPPAPAPAAAPLPHPSQPHQQPAYGVPATVPGVPAVAVHAVTPSPLPAERLPYPAPSTGQYAAHYYPAVPQ